MMKVNKIKWLDKDHAAAQVWYSRDGEEQDYIVRPEDQAPTNIELWKYMQEHPKDVQEYEPVHESSEEIVSRNKSNNQTIIDAAFSRMYHPRIQRRAERDSRYAEKREAFLKKLEDLERSPDMATINAAQKTIEEFDEELE